MNKVLKGHAACFKGSCSMTHAQHDNDKVFYNRSDYNRKIFVKDNRVKMPWATNEVIRRTAHNFERTNDL